MDVLESFIVKFEFIKLCDSLLDLVFKIGVLNSVTTGLKFKFLKIVIFDIVNEITLLGLINFVLASFKITYLIYGLLVFGSHYVKSLLSEL
jgi:hypothetical protein